MSSFIPCPWASWCFCHITALFLLWYHLPLCSLLLLGLRAEVSAMPLPNILSSFSFYYLTFLLDQFTQYLGLPRPILVLGRPQPISFFRHSRPASFFPTSCISSFSYFLHSHGLLLNLLGFLGPITTSLPLGLLAFKSIPLTNSFLWALLAPFCFLYISYNSHGLTTSFFGASLAHLLSLEPLCYFVGLWTIILAIQV